MAMPGGYTVLDLFSGIGGISLGLHWAGMQTLAFCESDPFARAVLHRHWPGVPVFPDIRTLSWSDVSASGADRPTVLCGGFPCQDTSLAGRGAGLKGARSGLWSHMARLVSECRPRWVVAENVPGLRGRGADRVQLDLEALGYAGWPLVVGAAMPVPRTGVRGCGLWPGAYLPTPVARDWKWGSVMQRNRRRACQLNDVVGGRLHPAFVEWAMGFPPGWTAVPGWRRSATRPCLPLPQQSAGPSAMPIA